MSTSRIRLAVTIAGVMIAFVAGYVARGDATDPAPADQARTRTAASADTYPPTPAGAARAAADHVRLLGDQRLLDAPTRDGALDGLVTQAVRRQVDDSLATAGRRLGDPAAVVSRVGILATRVDEFAENRALVSVWHVAVVGSTDPKVGLPVQAMWRTARVTVVRAQGTWLLAGGLDADDVSPGPVPAFSPNQPAVSSYDQLARVARDDRGAF